MAIPIEILDPQFDVGEASSTVALNVAPVRVGTDWEPGDRRVVYLYIDYATSTSSQWTIGSTPTGWTKTVDLAPDANSLARTVILTRTLAAGDTDTSITFGGTSAFRNYVSCAFTQRNTQIATAVTATAQYVAATGTSLVAPSIATGTGMLVNIYHWVMQPENAPSVVTQHAGQTKWITNDYHQPHTGGTAFNSEMMISYEPRISGTSGTRTATIDNPTQWYSVVSLFIPQAPDVVATIGKATAVTSAYTPTLTLQNLTTGQIGKALETPTARQVFSPGSGYRTSPVYALPVEPIWATRIGWTETVPGVAVETTVDGGISWQTCRNGFPIPRLLVGTNTANSVQYRVTFNPNAPLARVGLVEMQVALDDARDEFIPLGLFLINDTVVTQTASTTGGGVTVNLSGVDISRVVSRNSWDDVYIIKGGIDYSTAIQLILDNRLPGLTYNFTFTGHFTPRLLFGHEQGGDPWQDAQDLATAIGYELFFDPFGVATLRPVPDLKISDAVWEYSDQDNPTITSVTRSITDASTFNRVVVLGESAGSGAPPVSAVAVDDDPASPTYYLGPYGTVTTTFTSPMVTSETQAQAAADALLLLVKGATENVDIEVIPNPTMEPGDVVTITVAGVKLTGKFMVNVITTPLGPDRTQTLTCYRQQQ